ncbi:MAG: hypothetical protein M3Y72_21350 [Acidobacteriota bacterium]|nr:hypothetical protein [Acidobacteriota bacterium]
MGAQTNVGLAWAERNASGLSWNNWLAFTPNGGQYSWDCSNTVVGMLDIPTVSRAADFSLASSSGVINLVPESSGSTTISVVPSNGFNGTVNLSVTLIGSPAGVSATLSQSSITDTKTATLTVSTTSATPGGNYLIAVTGTSAGIAHTIYVQLALPYFTLSVAPTSIYLNQGGGATGTITITPQNGFNGEVQFSQPTGLPEGVTASFHPESAGAETTLELAASSNAMTGINTPLSITGISGALTQTAPVTLTVSAATGDCGTGVPVDLSSAYNGTGIYPNGATYSTNGGLDGDGFSYSSDLLTNTRVLSGIAFRFGTAGNPDVVHGTGQTIPLFPGKFTTLQLLATGVGGQQSAQTVAVTYTDGTTSLFTQSFSDWFSPSYNANETEVVVMPYRNYADGTQNNSPFTLYGYTFLLRSDKVVKSITLPNNRNVVVLAATLARQYLGDQVNLSSVFNVGGIYTDGTAFSSNGGLDGGGFAYSANLLGIQPGASSLIVNSANFNLGAPNVNNAVYGTGRAIALPAGHFSSLRILGTGVGGNQTWQTIVIAYTDGTTSNFTQNFSDWFSPQGYTRESEAVKMAYRNRYDGSKDSQAFNLYQYILPLDQEKTVRSLMLPANRNVVALGMSLMKEFPDVVPLTLIQPDRLTISASGLAYSRESQTFNGTVTIKNISSCPIEVPIKVVFTSLTAGVTVANAIGMTNGSPYITAPAVTSLGPGKQVVLTVQFKNPSNASMTFTPVVYSGSFD